MNRFALWIACLLLVSSGAMAAPRPLIRDGSQIGFVVRQMGVPVSGEFKRFDAAIDFDEAKPESSSAEMRIEIGSLTTGNDEADAVAVDKDWLDKAHAPYATFKSSSIRALGAGRFEARGKLTIRNRTRDIVVSFNSQDQTSGKTVITGSFVIRRAEFGIGGGIWNDPESVAEDIPVNIRLLLAQPAAPPASSRKNKP